MQTMTKAVCVWLDSDSDRDNPKWIVSLDEISLPGGAAEETNTLHICDDEDDAMSRGMREAAKRRLPLYRNPNNEPAELVDRGIRYSVEPVQNTAAARRLRDRRFDDFSSAETAASEAAMETGYPVGIVAFDRDGNQVDSWTISADSAGPVRDR